MKKPSYKIEVRSFTDEQIQTILDRDENFRRLNPSHRDTLYEDMRSGRWADNANLIIFSDKGKLLDGQHRLSAAQRYQREKNDPVWFWVVEGMDEKVALTIDIGPRRTLNDYLLHHEVKNISYAVTVTTAIATMGLFKTKRNLLPILSNNASLRGRPKEGEKGSKMAPTLLQKVDVFKRHRKDIEYWAGVGTVMSHSGRLPNAAKLAAIGYFLAQEDEVSAKLFFDALATGEGIKDTDVLFMLRERLQNEAVAASRVSVIHIGALVIKAWRFWMNGETPAKLFWTSSGPRTEEFPDHRLTNE